MKRQPVDSSQSFSRSARKQPKRTYLLRLYVAGISPRSERAIRMVKEICEERLKNRYELEIMDIHLEPGSLVEDQVVVAPTLIKKLPLPLRRLIGDMANKEKVIVGLDLRSTQ